MGCDIHYVVEKKVDGRWIGLFSKWPRPYDGWIAGYRNYEVFAELAGVRGKTETSEPRRGIPVDRSDLAAHHIERDGDDGHSHSWLTVNEFIAAFVRVYERYVSMPDYGEQEFYARTLADLKDKYRRFGVLFGPCGITTYADSEREGDREENYRVVFWFDN